ncbi:membrane protein [Dickeya phage vB_DsoM_AD1]|uniref:Putative membrane protein n=1 Tax=Dickeya phage vB_DsoM_AD1 TaxID=2283029 RepID=A0A384ZY23_9CAUD|nr:membrane protein [Dickeya phage vB_DsoM_AD1]AXG67141.1 putative membrane protein [Dickeya phage vB_DsoM_AD1]
MWAEILDKLLASNYATVFSVVLLIIGGGYVWWKILPQLEELEQLRERNAELEAATTAVNPDSSIVQADLAQMMRLIQSIADSAPVDNLDMREGLNSVLRAMQRFERIISQQSQDHQVSVELMREVLDKLGGSQQELEKLGLRLQSISSSLYTTPNAQGNTELNDLRALR